MEIGDYDNYRSYVKDRIIKRSMRNEFGCLEYRPGILKHKYGLTSITIKGIRKLVPVHRAIYMANNDCFDLPRNKIVRHKCDNPRCVNIEHLEIREKKKIEPKIRATKYKPHTRQSKFTNEQIKAIRQATGKIKWIAQVHGCSIGYVSKIKNMKAKTLV